MPLTKKGHRIMAAMKAQYGQSKGERVFYASKNAGKITGVDRGFYGEEHPVDLQKRVIRTSLKPSLQPPPSTTLPPYVEGGFINDRSGQATKRLRQHYNQGRK